MKKLALLPLVALALAAGCSDGSPGPTALAPEKPFKDDIGNRLDASLDAVAEVMPLNVGGANGTTTLYVSPTNGDGKNGCNFGGGGSPSLTVSVSSSNTGVATVSPSSITFGSCGETPTLTVTPVGQGSAAISLAQTSNSTGATFDLTKATFTVNVAPPANTAPSISILGVAGGSSYDVGSVPAAMCSVTDAEDGNKSFAATLSGVTGPYAGDGIGEQTASCSYTDNGGLTATASATYGIVDPTAPTIGYTLSPASPDGSNGWYRSNVVLTWAVTEAESPSSLDKSGCVDQNITADQAGTTYSCSATSAGGSASPVQVTIKRDATAPGASAGVSPAANAAGWHRGAVTVSFSGTDTGSGIASCTDAVVLSAEGAGQQVSGTCTDNAGNVSASATRTVNIDMTDPVVSLSGGPADGATYYFGSVPAAPSCSASDALSGLNGGCDITGYGSAVGSHTVQATATDRAGNQKTVSATYTVKEWTINGFYSPVNMQAVNTVKGGSTVPLKFEVFAGQELTSTSAITSFRAGAISCAQATMEGGVEDPVDFTTTGGTSLRYDATAGQFIQNWQTPKTVGQCYRVTMTTQDGSSISTVFKTK
jgi:hypothetical protein